MSRVFTLIMLVLLGFVSACRKDFKKEYNAPLINIISPANGATYTCGDTVPVKVNFGDDTKVQAIAGNINRFLPASSIFDCAKTMNTKTATLDTFMVIPGVLYGNYQFEVYAQDPYENFTLKTVNFTAILP